LRNRLRIKELVNVSQYRNKRQKMNLSTRSLYPIINLIWSMVVEEEANYNKEVN